MNTNATISVTEAYAHVGWVAVGGGSSTDDLKFTAIPADGENIYMGAICSLDAEGELVAGLNSANAVPLWALNNIGDFDVAAPSYALAKGYSGNLGNILANSQIHNGINTLVGIRGYEIFTSEFVDASFAPNDLLKASSTAGKVEKISGAWDGSVQVVGRVSRGEQTPPDRQFRQTGSVLYLWTDSQLASS